MVPYALCDLDDHFVDNNQSRGYFSITLVVQFYGEQLKITIRIPYIFFIFFGLLSTLISNSNYDFHRHFSTDCTYFVKKTKKENSTKPISDPFEIIDTTEYIKEVNLHYLVEGSAPMFYWVLTKFLFDHRLSKITRRVWLRQCL